MDPTIIARLDAIEKYLGELSGFLNSAGPVGGLARAGVNRIGTAVGDPSLLAQVIAITDWIAKSAGTTVTPDPAVVAALANGSAVPATSGTPKSGPPANPLQAIGGALQSAIAGLR